MNFDRLLQLRLLVGRFGEMDRYKWWNTRGQLGQLGTAAVRRGFPRTHFFAQARSVFAVAAERCREIFDAPHSATLWQLTDPLEDEFDSHWERWLDHQGEWMAFFQRLENLQEKDLTAAFRSFELVTSAELSLVSQLQRSAQGRAVALPSTFTGTNEDVALLALAFTCGEPGSLAVPYARWKDA